MAVFLRAVMPTGSNRIPSMARLAQAVSDAGYVGVRTYIQSGNVILGTDRPASQVEADVHAIVLDEFGADLRAIARTRDQLARAYAESPFGAVEDGSCVFFAFLGDEPDAGRLADVAETDWGQQRLEIGEACVHLWLPWDAKPKRLSNTRLEKLLGVQSTLRNRNVVGRILGLMDE